MSQETVHGEEGPWPEDYPFARTFGAQPGYHSQAAYFPGATTSVRSQNGDRPLRVIHVGQYMVRAGIEVWLKALIRHADPQRLTFPRCIVTSPLSDQRVMQEMPVPVEVGAERSLRRAVDDCDVLLISGPAEVGDWLQTSRPPVCVVIAHGETVWSRIVVDRCSQITDHVIAVSNGVREKVCNGFPSSVIYNGCDTSHLTRTVSRNDLRARFGLAPDDFVVGSVMRLAPEKNPEKLIEAIARLPRRFKLFLVGWGVLQQKLLYMANELAPLRCMIAPAEGNLGDYYAAFDAFCLPSEAEGFGLATLEAMLCGVPVATTATGFPRELLIDGVHYLRCCASADSIATALARMSEHPEWAAGLAVQGRRAAEQFGFAPRMCREYEDLLVKLCRQKNVI